MLFSATLAPEIRKLAGAILRDPATVQVADASDVADGIDESVYFVAPPQKPALLAQLVRDLPIARAIVFTRTKRGADRLVRRLEDLGIRSEAIHGNKSQNARQRALDNFRAGKTFLLVATDVASRGIDVDGITHVVNYDLTDEPQTYIHRIGRTARAGARGAAVSLCGTEELPHLREIERLIKRTIPVRTAHARQDGPRPQAKHPPHAPSAKPQHQPRPLRPAAHPHYTPHPISRRPNVHWPHRRNHVGGLQKV